MGEDKDETLLAAPQKCKKCDGGKCDQSGCHMPICDGGKCNQKGAFKPACGGGKCDQTVALNATCEGGHCLQIDCENCMCKAGGCQTKALENEDKKTESKNKTKSAKSATVEATPETVEAPSLLFSDDGAVAMIRMGTVACIGCFLGFVATGVLAVRCRRRRRSNSLANPLLAEEDTSVAQFLSTEQRPTLD